MSKNNNVWQCNACNENDDLGPCTFICNEEIALLTKVCIVEVTKGYEVEPNWKVMVPAKSFIEAAREKINENK